MKKLLLASLLTICVILSIVAMPDSNHAGYINKAAPAAAPTVSKVASNDCGCPSMKSMSYDSPSSNYIQKESAKTTLAITKVRQIEVTEVRCDTKPKNYYYSMENIEQRLFRPSVEFCSMGRKTGALVADLYHRVPELNVSSVDGCKQYPDPIEPVGCRYVPVTKGSCNCQALGY